MAVVANTTVMACSFDWNLEAANTNLPATTHRGSFSSRPAISTTTFDQIYVTSGTLAAAATATIDFYSFTNTVGAAVTITKLAGIVVKLTATVTGGQFKMEDGASNPLGFAWGVGDAITLTVGTIGAGLALFQGTTHTVSATARNVKISNPGSQTITYYVGAAVGL